MCFCLMKKIETIVPLGFSCAARAVQGSIESQFWFKSQIVYCLFYGMFGNYCLCIASFL